MEVVIEAKNSMNFRSGMSEVVGENNDSNGTQAFINKVMLRTESTLNASGKM